MLHSVEIRSVHGTTGIPHKRGPRWLADVTMEIITQYIEVAIPLHGSASVTNLEGLFSDVIFPLH